MNNQFTLSKIKIEAIQEYTSELLLDPHFTVEYIGNAYRTKLWGFLWGMEKAATFYYPENWWEAFKEAYFSEWLKEKFPVKMKKVVVTFPIVFPDFKLQLPPHMQKYTIRSLDPTVKYYGPNDEK